MKPIIKYKGGKSREIPLLIPYVPPYSGRYFEPFFGGGAVYFHLEPQKAVINDINADLMGFYSAVKSDYRGLKEELEKLQGLYEANRRDFEEKKRENPSEWVPDENEKLYYELRDMYNGLSKPGYSRAALYYFINKTAYSGMIRHNGKGEFNVSYGRYKNLNASLVTERHHDLLRGAEIRNGDYREVFEEARPGDFVFLDPPYGGSFTDYGNEEYKDGFGDADHTRLAEDFFKLPCKAMMVVGATPLTRRLYEGLVAAEYKKDYSANIRNRFKAAAVHLIVTNYLKRKS